MAVPILSLSTWILIVSYLLCSYRTFLLILPSTTVLVASTCWRRPGRECPTRLRIWYQLSLSQSQNFDIVPLSLFPLSDNACIVYIHGWYPRRGGGYDARVHLLRAALHVQLGPGGPRQEEAQQWPADLRHVWKAVQGCNCKWSSKD